VSDVDRVAKWKARAAEWDRLSTLARDDHIADVCRDMGKQAHTMARFWETWK